MKLRIIVEPITTTNEICLLRDHESALGFVELEYTGEESLKNVSKCVAHLTERHIAMMKELPEIFRDEI